MDTSDSTLSEAKYFAFLDKTRNTSVVNMFAAAPYLVAAFPGLGRKEADEVLQKWMAARSRGEP